MFRTSSTLYSGRKPEKYGNATPTKSSTTTTSLFGSSLAVPKEDSTAKAKTTTTSGPLNQDLVATNTMSSFTPNQRLRVALNSSLMNGIFYDTKFLAFSCRKTSGVVGRPLGIYANSAILKSQSTYFVHRESIQTGDEVLI